jgi:hypothetical protein
MFTTLSFCATTLIHFGSKPWPSLFRPDMYWWRLVLTVRKFCFVGVALMFSSTPLFQAWCVLAKQGVKQSSLTGKHRRKQVLKHAPPLPPPPPLRVGYLWCPSISVGILFISYALHVHFHPFLDPVKADAVHDRHGASFLTRGVKLVYVRPSSGSVQGSHCCMHS